MEEKSQNSEYNEQSSKNDMHVNNLSKCLILVIILLIVIAVELYFTNNKLDKIIDYSNESDKQAVVEIFRESEKTLSDVLPILDETSTVAPPSDIESTTRNSGSNISTTKTTETSQTEAGTTKSVTQSNDSERTEYILNTSSKKIHLPNCTFVSRTMEENKKIVNLSDDELKEYMNNGYTFCKTCGGN